MSAWETGANAKMDELLELEEELRERARAVRECPFCESGNVNEILYLNGRSFPAVRKCSCLLAWQDAGRDLNTAIRLHEKRTKMTYDRWDSSMTNITKRAAGPFLQINEVGVLREGLWRIIDGRAEPGEVIAEVKAEIAKREGVHDEARF